MPNVVIEHSQNIQDMQPFMQLCHDHLMASGLFKVETIKVRTISFDQYLVAGKKDLDFVVVNLSVMPGRTQDQRAELGESLHQEVMRACESHGIRAATSVVVKETPEGLYFKHNPS